MSAPHQVNRPQQQLQKFHRPGAAHLMACWPDPAVLQMRRRTLVEPPWLRNSEERVPDGGNLWASGPAEDVWGEEGRLWWYPEERRGENWLIKALEKTLAQFFLLLNVFASSDMNCMCRQKRGGCDRSKKKRKREEEIKIELHFMAKTVSVIK